jgi:hypothetical protein
MYFTKRGERRTIGDKQSGSHYLQGLAVLSSGIIDLAIGLTFVFGVTAALASMVTELIARLIGLRGAYLLGGLRELVDGNKVTTDLKDAQTDYTTLKNLMASNASAAEEAPAEEAPAEQAPAEPPPAGPPPAGQPPAGQPPPLPSATGALLGGPILSNQGMTGQICSRKLKLEPSTALGRLPKMTLDQQTKNLLLQRTRSLWRERRSLPSYISADSFAEAVIDLVVPDPKGQTTMTTIQQGIGTLPDMSPFKPSLQALVKDAEGDISRFRTSVEQWYDDHMDRVSGWYKRHVAVITLAIGAILVVLLNINALTIGRTLYTESTVNTAVSNVAAKDTNCPTPTPSPSSATAQTLENQQECLEDLQGQLSAAASAGLPIGWGTVRDCTEQGAQCNWLDQRGIFSRHGGSGWQLVLVLIGFLIMIIAIVPGAQFWFGLLTMLGSLRATGPKPTAAGN